MRRRRVLSVLAGTWDFRPRSPGPVDRHPYKVAPPALNLCNLATLHSKSRSKANLSDGTSQSSSGSCLEWTRPPGSEVRVPDAPGPKLRTVSTAVSTGCRWHWMSWTLQSAVSGLGFSVSPSR